MDDYGSDSPSYSASSSRHSDESSNECEDAEWLQHMGRDGSLLYVESYVSSTVREKQVQALRASGPSDRKPPYSGQPKDIKKKNKLLRLLKRRPSVRVKGARRGGVGGEGGARGGPDLASPPKVTFRDNPSGEVRKVKLQVYEGGNNLGRRASLCETVLGIIPGRFNEPPYTRVMVAGLLPGSHALRDGAIKIGDWLKEVEETDVTWDNLDDVLAELQIPSMITLSVQKCASETLPDEMDSDHKRVTQTQLVRVVTGSSSSTAQTPAPSPHLVRLPHTVLYLSLTGVTEDSPDEADIRYQFPGWSNKLVQVRGMFITAAHAVQEVVGAPALCSTVCLDGEYYHVAYMRENKDVLLLALPNSYVSSHELVALMDQLAALIRFEFATLSSGLGSGRHKAYLDHLFSLVLGGVLGDRGTVSGGGVAGGRGWGSGLNPYLPQLMTTSESFVLTNPVWLPLHHAPETKLQIDNCLSELESGDFGDDDSDYEDSLSLYNILGSCLFYKGHLVASHLAPEELVHVWLLVRHHGLLHLTAIEALSQLVGWRRVHPSAAASPNTSPGTPPTHYLLLVAMNHCLLCLMLEAGGITEPVDEGAGPDPVLVDQVEASLYQLHALHIHTICEESLLGGGIETVAADDKFGRGTPNKKPKERHDPTDGGLRLPDVPSILKQKSGGGGAEVRLEVGPGVCVGEGEGSLSGDSFTPSSLDSSLQHDEDHRLEKEAEEEEDEEDEEEESDWRIYKPSESRVLTQYDYEISPTPSRPSVSPIRVTSGQECALFHLVQLEVGEGVLIQTRPPPSSDPSGQAPPPPPLHSQVLHNFRSTCAHIHHLLHASTRSKENIGGYGSSSALSGIREHGVLFTYTPPPSPSKRRTHTFTYWVVGRILGAPYHREIYVCYHEAVPQNLLELAFRVAHGAVI